MLLGPPMMEVRLNRSLDGVALELENVVSITERGPAWFRYEADEPESLNPRVIRRLTDLGVEVITVSEVPRSLEEVYLRIVGTREQAVDEAGALPGQRGGGR
jgi:ABC-2 type transport system ATP-binding protein